MAHPDFLLCLLDAEWQQLIKDPAGRRSVAVWRRTHPQLSGCRTLCELVEAIDTSPLDESSRMVWALLALARKDVLARRVLLQVIVPGLAGEVSWVMSWARRVDPCLIGGGDIDQMVIAAGLDAIAHATGERRAWPIKSILRQAHRLLRRETRTREARRSEETPHRDIAVEIAAPVAPPALALVDLLNDGRRKCIVSDRDVELLWLIGVEGYTSAELADEFGTSARAVAQQRWRAETRLSAMVA